jgi:hypothetical protein
MREPVVLFGAGSAVIVEVEESCRRLGRPVAAIVQNTADPTWAQDSSLVVPLDGLDSRLFEYDVLVPLFRPANRRTAVAQVRQLGVRRFASVLDPTSILPAHLGLGEGIYQCGLRDRCLFRTRTICLCEPRLFTWASSFSRRVRLSGTGCGHSRSGDDWGRRHDRRRRRSAAEDHGRGRRRCGGWRCR